MADMCPAEVCEHDIDAHLFYDSDSCEERNVFIDCIICDDACQLRGCGGDPRIPDDIFHNYPSKIDKYLYEKPQDRCRLSAQKKNPSALHKGNGDVSCSTSEKSKRLQITHAE